MKKYSFAIKSVCFTLVVMMGFVTACNDEELLDLNNPNRVTPGSFYQSVDDFELAVTSVYAGWQARGLCNRMYFFGNDMPSDESLGTNNLQATLRQMLEYTWNANNGVIFEMFRDYYQGIGRANRVITELENTEIEIDAALKNRFMGEVRFLRAIYYFDLVHKWGGVPLVTSPPDGPIYQPRASVDEVYQLIIDDLTFAKNNLPTNDDYDDNNKGRATTGAATGYLGKVYLYRENWGAAETEFMEIINGQRGTYGLVDNFRWNGIGEEQVPEAENSMESLFEVQFQDALGSVWGIDGNGGGENTFRGVEYAFASFNNVRPRQDFADKFEVGDPRYEQTFYDDGVEWFQGTFTKDQFGGLIAWRKYHNYDIRDDRNQSSGINFRLMRYADVLLMAAEAKLNNGKPIAEVLDLVNQVKKRALDQKNNPNIQLYMDRTFAADPGLYPSAQFPANNTEQVMEIIMHERMVELAAEQHRYNDLKRWGLDDDVAIGDGKPYETGKHELWPIPLREIETNPEIELADQNPGY